MLTIPQELSSPQRHLSFCVYRDRSSCAAFPFLSVWIQTIIPLIETEEICSLAKTEPKLVPAVNKRPAGSRSDEEEQHSY